MKWYHYVGIFFAGVFLANAVPHFFHGISGDPFNVLWGVFNLAVGFILIRISNLSAWHTTGMIVFFLGVLAIAVQLSILFQEKHTRLLDVNLRECGSIRNPQNITSVPFAEITA
jgi:hypothetical protein